MIREVLLTYSQSDKPFIIHTDACYTQIGSVINQKMRIYYVSSIKLSPTQTRFPTTERKLLAIAETLNDKNSTRIF